MQNVKITILERLLNIVAPHPCINCGKIGQVLCASCEYNIMHAQQSRCLMCSGSLNEGFCGCDDPDLDFGLFVGDRSGVLQKLIGGYKFMNMRDAREVIARLLGSRAEHLPGDTIIVPVPTTPDRIRERGYDHMGLLTVALSKTTGLRADNIIGRRKGPAQHHMTDLSSRMNNARDAFFLLANPEPEKSYVILDDIFTSGATVRSIACLLRAEGAGRVGTLIIARQPLD